MRNILSPQPGPQTEFAESSADIVIFGGAAGGGKTYALLLEFLRYKNIQGFNAVIFRKNYTQVAAAGGLWDTSLQMYSGIRGARALRSPKYSWNFGGKSTLAFDYLSRENDVYAWQGSQICFIGFDELTHVSEFTFFYMLSRNRSICGVEPFVRATCNPDSDSWVRHFIDWWINPATGYAIPERSGVVRVFYRSGDGNITWGDSRREVCEKVNEFSDEEIFPQDCKTATFISSSVYDNEILLKANPSYLSSLKALSLVEKERLLRGNWKIRPAAGLYFKAEQTRIVKTIPDEVVAIARAWDLAATEISFSNKNPDRTAGVLMARMKNGQYIILDVKRIAANAANVRAIVKSTAATDKAEYNCRKIFLDQDPGQAGKEQAQSYIRELAGYSVKAKPVSGDKVTRAEPLAAQWQQGNVLLLEGKWNETFLDEMVSFPDALHDDQVDAASNAFSAVAYARTTSLERSDFIGF